MIRKKLIVGNHIYFARKGAKRYAAFAGTIAVTHDSANVVGTGTDFTTLAVGQTLAVLVGTTVVVVTITTITDGTNIIISAAWAGDTLVGLVAAKESPNTVSDSQKPVSTVPQNWTSIGSTLDLEPKNKREEEEVYDPSPGAYEIADIITKSRSLSMDGTIQEGSPELFEMLMMANGAITDAYSPLAGTGQIYAWWQIKQYDQENNLINTFEFWGIGTVDGQKFDKNLVRYKLSIRVLVNALNNGTLSLA